MSFDPIARISCMPRNVCPTAAKYNYKRKVGTRHVSGSRAGLFARAVFFLCCMLFISLSVAPGAYCSHKTRENAVVRAVRKVSPAVVNISTEYEVRYRANPFTPFYMDDFFKHFFDYGIPRKRKVTSLGSGVIIDGKRGFVLTNEHVVANASKTTVMLNDGREFDADVVGIDSESDLAVLKIKTDKILPELEMGDSDDLMIGETVIAIGNPFGFSNTVTTGVVSAVNRSIQAENRVYHDFIQTDASINPGNSGGPLLNIDGELIGINTAIYKNAEGIGFAIPINKAKKIVSDLITYGEVIPAWIGLYVQDIDKRLAQYLGVAPGSGILVQGVEKGSPAAEAGIKDGDVLLSMGTDPVRSVEDYRYLLRTYKKGDSIGLTLQRAGKMIKKSVKAGIFPEKLAPKLAYRLLGIRVVPIDKKRLFDTRISANKGVIISEIDPACSLASIGVRPGDVIRKIDEMPTPDPESFYKAIIKYRWKPSVVILLQRGGQGYYITVNL